MVIYICFEVGTAGETEDLSVVEWICIGEGSLEAVFEVGDDGGFEESCVIVVEELVEAEVEGGGLSLGLVEVGAHEGLAMTEGVAGVKGYFVVVEGEVVALLLLFNISLKHEQ